MSFQRKTRRRVSDVCKVWNNSCRKFSHSGLLSNSNQIPTSNSLHFSYNHKNTPNQKVNVSQSDVSSWGSSFLFASCFKDSWSQEEPMSCQNRHETDRQCWFESFYGICCQEEKSRIPPALSFRPLWMKLNTSCTYFTIKALLVKGGDS